MSLLATFDLASFAGGIGITLLVAFVFLLGMERWTRPRAPKAPANLTLTVARERRRPHTHVRRDGRR